MQKNRVKARIAQNDLQNTASRRIALKHGVDLLSDGSKHCLYAGLVCRPVCLKTAVAIIAQQLE